jgi:hypothetical protein
MSIYFIGFRKSKKLQPCKVGGVQGLGRAEQFCTLSVHMLSCLYSTPCKCAILRKLKALCYEMPSEAQNLQCDTCEKAFLLEWRFKKHIEGHNESIKFCHFYNNQLHCPFGKIGCMFLHSISPL